MALKIKIGMTALLLSFAAHAAPLSLELTLPDQTQVAERFYRQNVGSLYVYSLDHRFARHDGTKWIELLDQHLKEAYEHYKVAVTLGQLPFCEKPPVTRPATHLIFYNFKVVCTGGACTSNDELENRAGYFHRKNPGVLVQDRFWDSKTVQSVAIHEAVHAWCRHADYKSEAVCADGTCAYHEHWLEEGAADWVMYKTLGKAPQLSITKYFENPCAPTLYGSSFLWWLALTESAVCAEEACAYNGSTASFGEQLARVHLGLRLDVVYGALSQTQCQDEKNTSSARLPGGLIKSKLSSAKNVIEVPFWKRPQRRPQLTPPTLNEPPSGYFSWTE